MPSYGEQAALELGGCQAVLRGAAPDWPSGQAARRCLAAAQLQPKGPRLSAHGTASSFGLVSAYAPSLFLAPHALSRGATCSPYEDMPKP